MRVAAGKLAVRAINQYRRRDVLAYLGLRYYLDNTAARSDRWAREVAPTLVIRRSDPSYFAVQHFKDMDSRGNVAHRDMFVPSPNEALAEAALIEACSTAGIGFRPGDRVFSYLFPSNDETSGIFQNYMLGLRARHYAIAEACRRSPGAEVVFLDIRRFYPSVSTSLARSAWLRACESSTLPKLFVELGVRILDDYSREPANPGGGLLTGPMFSHLIANLILREVDVRLTAGPAQYFRYVDDMTLVGDRRQIQESTVLLNAALEAIGLNVHGPGSAKSFSVTAVDWLDGEHDYAEARGGLSWMTLIGDLKRLLLLHPEAAETLAVSLAREDFRLPLPDYTAAVGERGFAARVRDLVKARWFQARVRPLSVAHILEQARQLRHRYSEEAEALTVQLRQANTFQSKRFLPRLRYRLGRLAYLAESDRLGKLAMEVNIISGMQFQSAICRAIATGQVDEVIRLGTNAAQAVAQPLKLSSRPARAAQVAVRRSDLHALAVFKLNGVDVIPNGLRQHLGEDELLRFAASGSDARLMRSHDAFMREIACLHGLHGEPRHERTLQSAFDPAEDMTMDAIEQARQSFSL